MQNSSLANGPATASLSPLTVNVSAGWREYDGVGPFSQPCASAASPNDLIACSMPASICCIRKNVPISRANTLAGASLIHCKDELCNFVGAVHHDCMEQWKACVEMQLQNVQSGAQKLAHMRKFYECPQCEQPTLVFADNEVPANGLRRIAPQSQKRHSATGPVNQAKSPCDQNDMTAARRQVSLGASGRGLEADLGLKSNAHETSGLTSGFVSADCPSLSSLSLDQSVLAPEVAHHSSSSSSEGDRPPGSGQSRPLRSISEVQAPGKSPCPGANSAAFQRASTGSRSTWRPVTSSASANANNSAISPQASQSYGRKMGTACNWPGGGSWSGQSTGGKLAKFASNPANMMAINEKGNIFQQRKDVNAFERLPETKKNSYFIQLEDDSCTGNEDLRTFLLTQLTNRRVNELPCLVCDTRLAIYDHFPVIDGILFLSPIRHRVNADVEMSWNAQVTSQQAHQSVSAGRGVLSGYVIPPPGCSGPRQQQASSDGHFHRGRGGQGGLAVRQERYLHALCFACLRGLAPAEGAEETSASSRLCCRACHKPWDGGNLLVGGLYTYDVFAAQPCCAERLRCKACGGPAVPGAKAGQLRQGLAFSSQEETSNADGLCPFPYFSQYSQLITCQQCSELDYHFVRGIEQMFERVASSPP